MFDLLTLDDMTSDEMFDLFEQTRLLKLSRANGAPIAQPLAGTHGRAALREAVAAYARLVRGGRARTGGQHTLPLVAGGRPGQARGGEGCRARAEQLRPRHRHPHVQPQLVEELAEWASVPVINGLTDEHHPCQGLTDVFTIDEQLGGAQGKSIAYVGDGANCAHSLAQAAAKAGMRMRDRHAAWL